MGFRVNTNVAALNAHQLNVGNTRSLDNSLERLSSGLRINKSADDASGMAIADSLRVQANSLGQAISNANDAIGIIQTADKAMDEQVKILDTIKTKATQAAQDGQTFETRKAIQSDINRLLEELDNIAYTTSFNGRKLLSGSFTNKEFQIGAYSNETIKVTIGSTSTDKVGSLRAETGERVTKSGDVSLTFNGADNGKDVTLEKVTISTSAGTGIGVLAQAINKTSAETGLRATYVVESTGLSDIKDGDVRNLKINGVSIGNIEDIKVADKDGKLQNAINTVTDKTGVEAFTDTQGRLHLKTMDGRGIKVETADEIKVSSDGVIKAGDVKNLQINGVLIGDVDGVKGGDADGILVNAINARSSETGATARVEDGMLVVEANKNNIEPRLSSDGPVVAGDVTDLTINGVAIDPVVGVLDGDSDGRLTSAINARTADTGVVATIEGGNLVLSGVTDEQGQYVNPDMTITAESDIIAFEKNDGNKYQNPNQVLYVSSDTGPIRDGQSFNRLTEADENYGRLSITKSSARDILVSGEGAGFSSNISEVTTNLRSVLGTFDKNVASSIGANANAENAKDNQLGLGAGVTSLKGAMLVMDIAETSIKELDRIRANLGSVQNQLVATINNISVTQVNVKAAESQIRDVDFAKESADFSKYNILSQSGSYALSQANATQQGILRLLQ